METDKEDNKIIFLLCAVINKYLSLISDKKTISIYHIRLKKSLIYSILYYL